MNKAPSEILEMSKASRKMYEGYLSSISGSITYYDLIKNHSKKTILGDETVPDYDGFLLAFFLLNDPHSNGLWGILSDNSFIQINVKDLMRIISDSMFLAVRMPKSIVSKHELKTMASKVAEVSKFITKNKFLHLNYRTNDSPVSAGTFLKNHLQYKRNKAGFFEDDGKNVSSYIADNLNVKDSKVGSQYPESWSSSQILYHYMNSTFPQLNEILDMYADYLNEMTSKRPMMPRPNSDNVELHLFVRILRDKFMDLFARPHYLLLTELCGLLFPHIEKVINEDNIKQICLTEYDKS